MISSQRKKKKKDKVQASSHSSLLDVRGYIVLKSTKPEKVKLRAGT